MGRSVPGVPVAGPAIPAIPGVVLAAGLMAGPVGAQVGVPVAGPVGGRMVGPVGVPMVVLAAGLTIAPIWTGDAEGRTQRVRAPGAGWRGVEPVA